MTRWARLESKKDERLKVEPVKQVHDKPITHLQDKLSEQLHDEPGELLHDKLSNQLHDKPAST